MYVDDIILAGNYQLPMTSSKLFLDNQFKLKDLGNWKYLLDMEVARTTQGISLCQVNYALDVFEDAGYLGAKSFHFLRIKT